MRALPQAIERQQQLVTKQAPCNLLNPSNYKAINMILFSLRLLHVDVTVFTGVYKLSFINSFERAPFTPSMIAQRVYMCENLYKTINIALDVG